MKEDAVVYIHGKGGSATESQQYEWLFPKRRIYGLGYQNSSPWETKEEIINSVKEIQKKGKNVILIANSIGAFFAMNAGIDSLVKRAYFISPVVDMERLIKKLMRDEGVSEEDLKQKGTIPTSSGEELSWEYLSYVRTHPIIWTAPTQILYGSEDKLISFDAVKEFTERHNAVLTVMDGGEHWFHTEKQMAFLFDWIKKCEEGEQK